MKDKKQVASTMIRHMPTGMGGRTSRDAAIGGVEWFRWEEMISPNLTYPTEFLWPFNQTTGVCNFGKLNYYLGKRAADEGRPSRYGEIDFCKTPNKICDSEDYKELKWIAGMRMARIKRKQHCDNRTLHILTVLKDYSIGSNHCSLMTLGAGITQLSCTNLWTTACRDQLS